MPNTRCLTEERTVTEGKQTEPDAGTRRAERSDAEHGHTADRPPSPDEDEAAEREYETLDEDERKDVAEHYKDMVERGAKVKGEGEIK
jgi:hypothetical protein